MHAAGTKSTTPCLAELRHIPQSFPSFDVASICVTVVQCHLIIFLQAYDMK